MGITSRKGKEKYGSRASKDFNFTSNVSFYFKKPNLKFKMLVINFS